MDTRSTLEQALTHMDHAASLLAQDPPKIANARHHLSMARALLTAPSTLAALGGDAGGISPLMLGAGALAVYLLMKR